MIFIILIAFNLTESFIGFIVDSNFSSVLLVLVSTCQYDFCSQNVFLKYKSGGNNDERIGFGPCESV